MFGQHLCVDLYGCNKDKLKDPEAIKRWCDLLVKDIDMVAYGPPLLEHFATHNETAAGYTIVQMIETSHIAAEFAENIGEVFLSLFSCKPFNDNLAINMTAMFFEAESFERYDMKRGTKKNVFHITTPVHRGLEGESVLAIKALTGEMGRAIA